MLATCAGQLYHVYLTDLGLRVGRFNEVCMKGSRLLLCALAALAAPACFIVSPAKADSPTTAPVVPDLKNHNLFDPARHMRVAEVKPGMTGYGLTVFHGTKIEKFDVEVVSILRNFNAKSDVVLIRCLGDYLQHTGSIAGMSGSPVFLTDSAGHDRMLGAFAYGWPMTKDPVAGVQPIEYMLNLSTERNDLRMNAADASSASEKSVETTRGVGHSAWSLKDAGLLPLAWVGSRQVAAKPQIISHSRSLSGVEGTPGLTPLATPLMTSGLSAQLFDGLAPKFRAVGLSPLQAGLGGSAVGGHDATKLEPGSVLAVTLLGGDLEMTAIGTTTEVLGNKVWGFGHPFNNEGPIALPMGSGEINGVIANLQTSFKLGSLAQPRGTLTTDASVGVAGLIGEGPATIPIEITVGSAGGLPEKTYHFSAARHPKFTPMLVAAAFAAAASGSSELPQYNTVDYNVQLFFSNGQTVTLANRAVNASAGELFGDAAVVIQTAIENPFQRVMVKKITGSLKVRPLNSAAQIIDVNLPKSHYHPGDKVKAFVTYQPFHGTEAILPVELELPRDLPAGPYQLIVSDAQRFVADEAQSKPFRFMAENIGEVFSVLKDVVGIRQNAIYLRLLLHSDGVAIGHTAMQRLPSSRREILLASGRSNTTGFVSSSLKIIPTEEVMAGSSEFTIEIESLSKSAPGAGRATKPDAANPAPSKLEESKKVPTPNVNESPGKNESPKETKPGD